MILGWSCGHLICQGPCPLLYRVLTIQESFQTCPISWGLAGLEAAAEGGWVPSLSSEACQQLFWGLPKLGCQPVLSFPTWDQGMAELFLTLDFLEIVLLTQQGSTEGRYWEVHADVHKQAGY